MTIIDAVVVVLLIGAAWSGFRQGLVTAALALVGAVAGAVVGIRLAPWVMGHVNDSAAKVALGIVCVIVGVGVGEYAGASVGRLVSSRITWRPAKAVDHGLGLVGYVLAVLIITWMIALPLQRTPYPWLSSAVQSSKVLSKVNEVMPDGLRSVSARLGDLFDASGFPQILEPFAPAPQTDVPAPDAALARSAAVTTAQASILKVNAQAPSCSKRLEGTGFVIGKDRVMTNAHVVAGSAATTVEVGGVAKRAEVVLYDYRTDIAVLAVPGLGRPALRFTTETATTGDSAIVAGYPLDGSFTVRAARIRSNFDLRGPDIYGGPTVVRDVYTLRALVQAGNSGGPLLAPDGTVLGVVFGAAPGAEETGFALTAGEVSSEAAAGITDTTAASTGTCTTA